MPATPTSVFQNNTPMSTGVEIFTVVNGVGDTTFTITPTQIKSIQYATAFAMNATASTDDAYLVSFTPGAATADFEGLASGEYLVMVWGKIA